MDNRVDEATARNRWMIITVSRFAGAIMAMIGILIVAESIAAPPIVGYVLIAVGLIDVFLVPTYLARKWRSPDA